MISFGNAAYPVGTITYRPGPMLASADSFLITIKGKQTHGAAPWGGIDPIVIGSQVVMALQTIVSRNVNITEAPAIVTVGRFDVVTTDLGTVIDQVNRRFGTRFERFEHTPEDVELVFRLIDERERRPDEKTVDRFLSGELTLPLVLDRIAELDRRRTPTVRAEHAVPRPSRERESSATALRAELEDPALAEPLRRARALYERLASASMS